MTEFARGLSSFSSEEILKIKGKHSNKINDILGYVSKSEVIHKDDPIFITTVFESLRYIINQC
ncbi:hypothetical protein AKH20_02785 [Pelagibacteraceae bacterium GOM-A3]|nr:hypothetical protein AKH20_02785 [Pelagibacteraceae bacterium GOM-A3]